MKKEFLRVLRTVGLVVLAVAVVVLGNLFTTLLFPGI